MQKLHATEKSSTRHGRHANTNVCIKLLVSEFAGSFGNGQKATGNIFSIVPAPRSPYTGNFDAVAPVYDWLAKLVFGNALMEAQTHFLQWIPSGSRVLILGGGSGVLLKRLLHVQPACSVCYIDSSRKMISLSQKRVGPAVNVTFVQGTEETIPTNEVFDVILTNFYLDLFSEPSLPNVVEKIKRHLKPGGTWLATDFVRTDKLFDRLLLRAMYRFFNATTNMETSVLPDWEGELGKHLTHLESKSFRGGFVHSCVFRRGITEIRHATHKTSTNTEQSFLPHSGVALAHFAILYPAGKTMIE